MLHLTALPAARVLSAATQPCGADSSSLDGWLLTVALVIAGFMVMGLTVVAAIEALDWFDRVRARRKLRASARRAARAAHEEGL